MEALRSAEVIVGYSTYLAFLDRETLQGKEVISTGMTQEVARCRKAISRARDGLATAVVCSGDCGIYAMAGLILEMLEEQGLLETLDVEVIPGIPALAAGSALLGAPLMHDFACISLSDLLTPWELIQQRIAAASQADFVLVLYNPRSKKRDWQLDQALKIIRDHRQPGTPMGVVRNAAREGQQVWTTTLEAVRPVEVDMLCTVFVGNSQTRLTGTRMITPRGYGAKYDLKKTAG